MWRIHSSSGFSPRRKSEKPGRAFEPQQVVNHGPPQIQIDKQDRRLQLRLRQRQVQRHECLAFGRRGAGHHDRAAGPAGLHVIQPGAQNAEFFGRRFVRPLASNRCASGAARKGTLLHREREVRHSTSGVLDSTWLSPWFCASGNSRWSEPEQRFPRAPGPSVKADREPARAIHGSPCSGNFSALRRASCTRLIHGLFVFSSLSRDVKVVIEGASHGDNTQNDAGAPRQVSESSFPLHEHRFSSSGMLLSTGRFV